MGAKCIESPESGTLADISICFRNAALGMLKADSFTLKRFAMIRPAIIVGILPVHG
ncbi:MAG: hypothetical protein ACJA0B_000203 [Alcanivorax borkumensis]|jgi:hypothetical protein